MRMGVEMSQRLCPQQQQQQQLDRRKSSSGDSSRLAGAGPRGARRRMTAFPQGGRLCCGGAACRVAPSPWASPITASGPMQVGYNT